MNRLHVTLAVSLLLTALPGYSNPLLQPGNHSVGKIDLTLTDPDRPTITGAHETTSDQRILNSSVWYPAQPREMEWLRYGPSPLDRSTCPAPLVIYSHGFMSMRHNGAHLAEYLASQGYIVAAATFPLTHLGTIGGPQFTDVLNQPGDVSFLIDSLLDNSTGALPGLADCIDPERIAAVGLSLGGITTALLAFHPELHDPRIAAAVSIAAPLALLGEHFFQHDTPPFMMIAGDIDAIVDYRDNVEAPTGRSPNTTIVTLRGGSHTGFAGLSAWLFRWLDNPDSIGCWALRGTINGEMEVPGGFMAELRGDAYAAGPDMSLLPCRNPELPQALRPQHQLMLTRYAIYAFLQGTLHADSDTRERYTRLLEETLPDSYPELGVDPHR